MSRVLKIRFLGVPDSDAIELAQKVEFPYNHSRTNPRIACLAGLFVVMLGEGSPLLTSCK